MECKIGIMWSQLRCEGRGTERFEWEENITAGNIQTPKVLSVFVGAFLGLYR